MPRRGWLTAIGLGIWMMGARAQTTALSPSAKFFLLTQAPGTEVYSQFGHSALRLRDPERHLDVVFNYGTFSFQTDYFVLKFARGKLDYLLSLQRYADWLRQSERERRAVRSQMLLLSPTQRQQLAEALFRNLRPENRAYRYDFFFDNCATRLQRIVERALGDSVRFDSTWSGGKSFRELLRPYLADNPGLGLGIHLALGSGADASASARGYGYLPDSLARSFAHAQVRSPAGWEPLTGPETLTLAGNPLPPPSVDYPLLLSIGLALLGLWFSRKELPKPRDAPASWGHDRWLFFILGLAGVFLALLWWGTDHRVTPYNGNLLWAFPLHALVVWLPVSGRWRAFQLTYGLITAVLALFVPILGLLSVQYFPPAVYILTGYVLLRSWLRVKRLRYLPISLSS